MENTLKSEARGCCTSNGWFNWSNNTFWRKGTESGRPEGGFLMQRTSQGSVSPSSSQDSTSRDSVKSSAWTSNQGKQFNTVWHLEPHIYVYAKVLHPNSKAGRRMLRWKSPVPGQSRVFKSAYLAMNHVDMHFAIDAHWHTASYFTNALTVLGLAGELWELFLLFHRLHRPTPKPCTLRSIPLLLLNAQKVLPIQELLGGNDT